MKFLCPSCKAKYQIADEKVAGRSVRMKCRKCGYVIHVSKAVTDGTASEVSSSEWPPSGPGASTSEARSSAPPPQRPSSIPPPPPARTAPTPKVANRPAAPTRKSVPQPTPPPARAATRSMPQAAPKPAPAAPAAKVTGQGAAQAAALAARTAPVRAAPPPRAAPPRAVPTGRAAQPARKGTLQGVGGAQPATSMFSKAAAATAQPFADEDKTRIVDSASALAGALSGALATDEPPSSALAGAFSDAVGEPSSALGGDLSADEWYVGINGVPVGPIRLSELRSKAGSGAVSYDSLVWRDGFEEWQPLRTFPELVAIVEESQSSARASLTPQIPPTASPASISVQMPGSIPITVASPSGNGAGGMAPVTGPAVVTETPEALEELLGLRRRGSSAAAWIAVVVALLFGLTAGFVLFSSKKPAEPIVKYVEVPAKGQASGASPAMPAPSAEALPESTVAGGKQSGGRGPAVAGTGKAPEEKKGVSGLQGLEGLKGLGPAGGGDPAGQETRSAGQPLDGTTVQRTVGRYTSSVRRSCWQPALDTRANDAPTSARVNVTITVGAGGNVQNVSTSGEPRGYRGLANCIASRVRGWQFPASSGTTTVNVPFVFAAQ